MTGGTGRDGITPSDQPQRGYDIAKKALEEARAKARAEGKQVGRGRTGSVGAGRRLRKRGWTGAGADPWDPQPLGRLVGQVAKKRGWDDKVATGRLFAEWGRIVGEDVSSHATPERLEEGILHVRTPRVSGVWDRPSLPAGTATRAAGTPGPHP